MADEPRDPVTGDPVARQEPEAGTTPKQDTKDATTPRGNGDTDEDAVRTANEKLHQAAGGH
ncbi:MAG: hypothetical protein QOE65_2128 [Solirubrobacteraceae bacterium]|jgi:hypothetical protein|nr:hypothetical protein [Solirubrobacteraceae bacterium]